MADKDCRGSFVCVCVGFKCDFFFTFFRVYFFQSKFVIFCRDFFFMFFYVSFCLYNLVFRFSRWELGSSCFIIGFYFFSFSDISVRGEFLVPYSAY